MAEQEEQRRSGGFRDRYAMWRALRTPAASGFVSQPEPRTIGLYSRGKQVLAGNFVSGGQVVERPGMAIWDVPFADPGVATEAHGFAWLDDLAAVGDSAARKRAQDWLAVWIARFGQGRGPGWSADLTGRRLIRWINHALMLLQGAEAGFSAASAVTAAFGRRRRRLALGRQ